MAESNRLLLPVGLAGDGDPPGDDATGETGRLGGDFDLGEDRDLDTGDLDDVLVLSVFVEDDEDIDGRMERDLGRSLVVIAAGLVKVIVGPGGVDTLR